ncbi:hypothetical protein GCM10008023_19740 [Sphingomonas glacialis]|uniref:DUF222 domain-containing protein n=1 Tax=Sphingomonas glacialis TaxID=658225 RepID=A0ABQ3LHD7_9SPHN|nr:hypothetical protein [Sphingomonas glacialis]GHH16109.1 hypothetical protein GCM10008023_19740 [Sphingomonas glacialis]
MLDTIVKSIIGKLDVHLAEVRAQRAQIERERAGGAPRTITTAILKHPEGYASSPREAAESAQKAYAKARKDWEKQGIPLLALAATLAIARERRDETAAVLSNHEESEAIRKSTKVHPDFRRLNDAMIAHGVQTGHAATAADGTIAIVSDILQWAGADPEMLDPSSPLPAILQVYASRLILTPGQFGDRSRSKPGVPVPQVKYTDPEHYLFNGMVEPHHGSPQPTERPNVAANASDEVARAATTSREASPRTDSAEPIQDATASAAPVLPVQESEVAPPGAVQITHTDEYALPPHISEADAAQIVEGGRRWVNIDTDWPFELKVAIGFTTKTDAEIIASVEAAVAPAGETPFRYFLDAARSGGVDAGHAAYREATIRRFAYEFATRDEWKDVRANLNVPW